MKQSIVIILFLCLAGCQGGEPPQKIVAQINDYRITAQEFEQGFAASVFAAQENKTKAREDYLESLIDQKVILQNAQKNNLDKDRNFLKSIERFWEQSLLTLALKVKGEEIAGSLNVSDEQIRAMHDQMVRDGVTTKSFDESYLQIKWMAVKQLEQEKLKAWIGDLRKTSDIKVNKDFLKAGK